MITYKLLSQVLVSDNLVPRVFSLSNMAAAGEKTFSPEGQHLFPSAKLTLTD